MAGADAALTISRRKLLIGGGIGAGLLVAWAVWPRHYLPNLRTAPDETLFNAFLKIGSDGRIVVAVPQAELGQGVYTSLPQILADELGADWRTVAVEPAPLSPLYANRLLAEEIEAPHAPEALRGITGWAVREYATRSALMITGGSTSVRAFEQPLRDAGAAARALLSKSAAERWNVDWETLDTHGGFVWNGNNRISFAELAADAAHRDLPGDLPYRGGEANRLAGEPLPRLDLPSKIDGTAQFACDIRLPGMVYASVRQGPFGDTRLTHIDRVAAQRVPGLLTIVENPRWVAAVATNWWAANRAVEALRPRFETQGLLADDAHVESAFAAAIERGRVKKIVRRGDFDRAEGTVFEADYSVALAPTAAVEPLTATARISGDGLEIWAATQAPGFARAAAARAAGMSPGRVTLYPTLAGGGYGRRLENAAIEQAAILAGKTGRPVQLSWSRIEETLHDSFRPPARASMGARVGAGGSIAGWHARIAAPPTLAEVSARMRGHELEGARSEDAAVAGAEPPYAIANLTIEHLPVAIGVPTGIWRSAAHSYTAFFTESFIDELARQAKVEPLSFRMQMLGDNPRLARALTTAAQLGGWDGGAPGSAKGIAAHSAFGSHAALVVEIAVDKAQRPRVSRVVCAVDCGRIINPDIVKQQVEGAIIFGIAAATGNPIRYRQGLPTAIGYKDLGLPLLAESPEVIVELIPSDEDPGGVTELGVPPVAPAIANALFALTGLRRRSLPLVDGSA